MNEAVDALLGLESQRVRENSDAATAFGGEERCFSLPLYDIKVSAGTGQFLDSDHYEVVELRDPPPRGTSFMVQVAGDSMALAIAHAVRGQQRCEALAPEEESSAQPFDRQVAALLQF